MAKCPKCNGSGKCASCNGAGKTHDIENQTVSECVVCFGTGSCNYCMGKGQIGDFRFEVRGNNAREVEKVAKALINEGVKHVITNSESNPLEIQKKQRLLLFWQHLFRPAWKWFVAGPPFLYGWFAFVRDEFMPDKIRQLLHLGGIFRDIAWYWWVISGLVILFGVTIIAKTKYPPTNAR